MQQNQQIQDQNSLRRCREGDQKAFAELYHRYGKMLFNVIYRLVGNLADAEDLMQESFVAMYQELEKGAAVAHFGGWSKRIVINRSISFLRKQKLLIETIESHHEFLPTESDEDIWEHIGMEQLKATMAQLSLESRTIVTLFVVENISQEEIAKILGISHNAVRTKYFRAKKKLYDLLQKEQVK